jgi:hypothetical protein
MDRLRSLARTCLRRTGLYHPLHDARRDWRFRRRNRALIAAWRREGCPPPAPDLLKYGVIRDYARRHGIRTLVETGTFYGNAIFTLRRDFTLIHSIELAPALHALNRRELAHLPHIRLHLGDSATVLPELLRELAGPALFWLDGHFCAGPSARGDADTPIGSELGHLLAQPAGRHVVLIDDARLFTGRHGYPTVAELRELIRRHRPLATCEVELDIIRIAPV